GGGTTEVAVISLGGIVTTRSLRVGGDELDQAIITHVKKEHSLLLGTRTAEEVKVAIGMAYRPGRERLFTIRGRDLVTGLPRSVDISDVEIHEAINEPLQMIVDSVQATLDECPPELAGDLVKNGL